MGISSDGERCCQLSCIMRSPPKAIAKLQRITVARLNHPGIATIYELFQREDQWLMVMEFVRGETLDNLAEGVVVFASDGRVRLCRGSVAGVRKRGGGTGHLSGAAVRNHERELHHQHQSRRPG